MSADCSSPRDPGAGSIRGSPEVFLAAMGRRLRRRRIMRGMEAGGDRRLVAEFLDGGETAANEIRGWVERAAQPFRRKLGFELEDVVQEAMLEITRYLQEDRFEGRGSLRGYVWRTVSHSCLDRLRAHRRVSWMSIEDLSLPTGEAGAETRLARRQSIRACLEIANRAAESCRQLWRMILEGKSYRQMSAELGVSEGALRVRVLRCRRQALALRRESRAGVGDDSSNETRSRAPKESEGIES